MANLRLNHRRTASLGSSPRFSPRGEVGEIDTKAPFQSVKAAVSLFGEVAKEKPTLRKSRLSSENVLDKETQLMLAQREEIKLKKKLETAEAMKVKALSDLDKNRRTLEDLTEKLKIVAKSKQSAITATEAVKKKLKELEEEKSKKTTGNSDTWKQELNLAREQYVKAFTELDATKQELNKIRQDFDVALEGKLAAFQQAAEAQRSAKLNSEKANDLSKDIAAMKDSLQKLKEDTQKGKEEHDYIVSEKEARVQSYQAAKEETEKKVETLRSEYDPELTIDLEVQLAETSADIEVLQEEMKNAHASDMNSVREVTMELNEATKTLQQIAEEESSLRELVSSMRQELDNVQKECRELEQKEAVAESLTVNLQAELENCKVELEAAALGGNTYDEKKHLTSDTENMRQEAEEMNRSAEELMKEAASARTRMEELERKLQTLLEEVEDAKAAEKNACDEMKNSEAWNLRGESAPKIKMTVEEFDVLSRKVQESDNLAEMKVAAATFQMEAIKASREEADKKLKAALSTIEEIKAATDLAVKNSGMAEAAQRAVEAELQKRHQEEQTMAE